MIDTIGPLAHRWVLLLAILAEVRYFLVVISTAGKRLSGEGPGRLEARKSPSGVAVVGSIEWVSVV